jgi:hypothetical protein
MRIAGAIEDRLLTPFRPRITPVFEDGLVFGEIASRPPITDPQRSFDGCFMSGLIEGYLGVWFGPKSVKFNV